MKHEIDEHTEASTEPSRAEAGMAEPPNTEGLARELEQANAALDAMRGECRQLDNGLRERRLSDPFARAGERHRELLRQVPQLESRAQAINDQLTLLGKIEAFQTAAEEAPGRAQSAHQAMVAAEQRRDELESRAAIVRARAEKMQAEIESAEESAQSAEADAAKAYAVAISGGDSRAEKPALAAVQRAQAAGSSVRAAGVQGKVVVDAMLAEAESLERQAEAARSEAEEHRLCLFRAIETHLQSRWDLAVARLAEIGAQLRAVSTRIGTPSPFWQLRVGRFDPRQSWDLTEDDLAAEFSDDALIAEVSGE
jgi:chromosome segregation ATPase